jgi:hypothetical protein
LTGEHDAALSPVIDPLTNITVGRPVKPGHDMGRNTSAVSTPSLRGA